MGIALGGGGTCLAMGCRVVGESSSSNRKTRRCLTVESGEGEWIRLGREKKKQKKKKKGIIDISLSQRNCFTKPNHTNCFRFPNEFALGMKPPLKPVLVIAGALLNRSLDMNHDL
jgi:hypothetical protein